MKKKKKKSTGSLTTLLIHKFYNNYSEASKGSLNEECEATDKPTAECVDYGKFLDELYILRDAISPSESAKKSSLVDTLKNIKLTTPTAQASEFSNSPELDKALANARAATALYGVTAPEAKLAWETYEEIASSGTGNSIGVNLMEECSLESGLDACKAMEELERVMPVLLAISKDLK